MKILDKSLNIALSLFPKSDKKKSHHFTFVFRRSRLLVIGQNNPDNESPKILRLAERYHLHKFKQYAYPHSETDAISKLYGVIRIGPQMTFVNVRLSSGGLRNSKPCLGCQEIIAAFGPKVYYTTEKGFVKL
jgi:hypothetical protein